MKIRYFPLVVGLVSLGLGGPTACALTVVSLGVPVEDTTTSLQSAIEQAVPAKVDQLGAWDFQGSTGIRYGARRGPISVVTTANAVRATARIEYAFRACQRVNKPWPLKGSFCQQFAQCGFGEPLPQIEVSVDVSGTWSPDWAVKPAVTTRMSVIAHDCQYRRVWPGNRASPEQDRGRGGQNRRAIALSSARR
jgi:hypothetical protein